jgi:hypothetical protein
VKVRIAVLAAFVAAWAAAGASAAPATFKQCGTVKSGGATWRVVAAGVACSTGKPLVRKLATEPHSLYTRLGTFRGLECIEIAGNAKREIACVSSDGRRSVYGVART